MKSKKGNDFIFSDFLKELKESSTQAIAKPVESQPEKQYFLIVSEGERTEPLYFEFFKSKLPKSLLDTIKLFGEGANTVDVVRKAIQEKEKREQDNIRPNFDQVWAVFDKDDFSAERVNSALEIADLNSVKVGYSNQSFELWYVLHFQYLDASLHRNQYYPILSKHLKIKYEKNSKEIVEKIFELGDINFAIKNAKRLFLQQNNTLVWNACPSTSVFKLVEELRNYCNV